MRVDGSGCRFAADGSWVEVGAVPGEWLGLVLLRRGGFAVGVAEGPALRASKVGTRYVQARTAAGGWSQHRFARRREGQARELVRAAADVSVRLLLPEASRLDSVVTGGDRAMLDALLADRRLALLRARLSNRVLDVPDPRLNVLQSALADARTVPLRVHDVLRDARPPLPGPGR